jgi:hypothetical protein
MLFISEMLREVMKFWIEIGAITFLNLKSPEECCPENVRLTVFSERVAAFCATQELSRRFVRAPGLHLPHISRVVTAFRAFNPYSGQRPQFLLFLTNNGNELLGTMLDNLANL